MTSTIKKAIVLVLALIFVGAVYSLLYCIWLASKNWPVFMKNAKILLRKYGLYRKAIFIVFGFFFTLAILFFYAGNDIFVFLLVMSILSMTAFYLLVFVKAVENSCLLKWVEPRVLTVGDWIAKDVFVAGKRICGPKDLGVVKSQINKLIELKNKGKLSKVLLKTGIPFTPSFLLAFILLWLKINILTLFLSFV